MHRCAGGCRSGREHTPGRDDVTSWGALLIMPTRGGGYANERPCIDGHGGSHGGGVHNSRAGYDFIRGLMVMPTGVGVMQMKGHA